jgi:glucuronate isomerase
MATQGIIHDDFLLQTEQARTLYHDYAADMPIIDYHCHLPPAEIAADKRYRSITEVWLGGDHYKWRAMRTNGIDEKFCTGDASDWDKFVKWAETMPKLLRNPLYHWTHLELARYFDISDKVLSPETAEDIYEACNARLQDPDMSCRGMMKHSNVVLVATTDDPIDNLEHHRAIAADSTFDIQVLPAWRPDKGMNVANLKSLNDWINQLAAAADLEIRDFDSYLHALRKRHDFFHENGCRLSDHGIETAYADDYTDSEIKAIFLNIRGGKEISPEEGRKFQSAMLYEFGIMDHEKGWTQQYHLGALRSANTRMLQKVGPDSGFDSIGDFEIAKPLAKLLDRLDQTNQLAKTILYNLNPRDNYLIATMLGNFQDGSVPGKIQMGSGWWFLDQKEGMEMQMEALSQLGLLSRFVGMLTDSRSFLSYTRHEYFRRILCNILGNDMANGLVPDDMKLIGQMVKDISYNNAASYFGFDLPPAK